MLIIVRSVALVAFLGLAAPSVAQCSDPPAPPTGFPVATSLNQLVVFTDLYQTRADARWPSAPAGPCGWPLLVIVHGFPGTKQGPVATMALDYAPRGYFVVTYDVRGQGSAIGLNPGRGTTLMALPEWIDMFEIMEWAEATWPGLIDFGRIAVTGISQGGAHSWAAAAWSGQTPPPNPRRSAPFPVVSAVAPTVMVPSHSDAATFDGTAFVSSWASMAFVPPNPTATLDTAFQLTMRNHLQADDPEGMQAWMRADPGRDFQSLLATSTTATLVTMSWLDTSMAANRSLQALAQMPATTPKRMLLTTGLHGTPMNTWETSRVDEVRRAWFDRLLKDAMEPVEFGPPVLSAVIPPNSAAYLAGGTLWRHRADQAFPPPGAVTQTWFLRQGSLLTTAAPTNAEPPELVQHVVPPGYGLTAWRAIGAGENVPLALSQLPLSVHSWTTAPFAQDTEIAGMPELLLEVTPQQNRFQLAARLEVLPAVGAPQVIAQGGRGVRQAGLPTPATIVIEMSATNCVVPAGSSLRLSVQNHYLVKPATSDTFRTVPLFVTSTTQIEHSPTMASRLLLPMRTEPGLDAVTATRDIQLAQPASVQFQVRSSPQRAGANYWLLGSLVGQGPALTVPGGGFLHLSVDALTLETFNSVGSPLFQGFVGVLDANGAALATMTLASLAPLPATLSGVRAHFAPIASQGVDVFVGPPLELVLR